MQLIMFKSKIHRATITGADLNYEGSIGISEDLIKASGLIPNEKVDIYNINNGERFSTYVIVEPANSGQITLNGAAARLAIPGDKVIIVAYGVMNQEDIKNHKPKIVVVDDNNKIIKK